LAHKPFKRNHDASTVRSAVERTRRRIANISLDLIFGVPGQSVAEWVADLRQAVELDPKHLSTYGLTYERGTRLWKQREMGQVTPLDEGLERDMYALAMDELSAAGFEQYEISNLARPGYRSRHNQVYWANEAYYGFGLGAARYIHGRREVNTRDLDAYIRKVLAGESVVQQSEELPPEERARETAAVQLRRAEGIERAAFRRQTGFDLDELVGPAVEKNIAKGLLMDNGRQVFLNREGKFLADGVCSDMLRN
jgi:oxygen-independent coproporphyrinogen III oxidase